jgi:hypothetical protein
LLELPVAHDKDLVRNVEVSFVMADDDQRLAPSPQRGQEFLVVAPAKFRILVGAQPAPVREIWTAPGVGNVMFLAWKTPNFLR